MRNSSARPLPVSDIDQIYPFEKRFHFSLIKDELSNIIKIDFLIFYTDL